MRARRRAARGLVAAGLALGGLAAVAPGSSAQNADRPSVFAGRTSARAVIYFADRQTNLTPLPETFHGEFPEASSQWDSAGETKARASIFYPGNAAIAGPGLACGAISGNFPPEFQPIFAPCATAGYPLSVQADSANPDQSTVASTQLGRPGDAVSGNAGSGKAHVSDDEVSSEAEIDNFVVAGFGASPTGPLPGQTKDTSLLKIGSMVARTEQGFDGPVLGVTAEARASGISIAAGLVTIDSVVARSVSASPGTKPASTTPEVIVKGVRALGQPATITQDGITVGDGSGSGGTGPLNDALQAALKNAGISIRLVGTSKETKGNETKGDAQGVLVSASQDLHVVPSQGDVYYATFLIGSAGSSDYGDLSTVGSDLGGGDLNAVPAGTDVVPSSDIAPSPDSGSAAVASGTSDIGGTGGQPRVGARTGGGTVTLPARTRGIGFLGGVAASRLRLLYLAFTLTALGLCLTPRLTLPARLPRRGGN